jgi:glucose-6-phosphate-specific signal transduction histidine kinase
VEVSLEVLPKILLIRVRDDGIGVPPERLQALRAHGLAAMRHRAVALGGQWRIVPALRGTEIEVRLPLEKIEAAPVEEEPYWVPARSLANPRSSDGSRK